MRAPFAMLAATLLSACRPESHTSTRAPVGPPVESPDAIPDAPLNGTVRGAPFTVRDARYVIDRRRGYAHTDVLLSSARASSPCGPLSSPRATSVWLRLDGPGALESKDWRLRSSDDAPWSVHFQAYSDEGWVGVAGGDAILSIRDIAADGRVRGGLAACFGDGERSWVYGSFDAVSCPTTLDQPVRGTLPPETIPAKYAAPPPPHP